MGPPFLPPLPRAFFFFIMYYLFIIVFICVVLLWPKLFPPRAALPPQQFWASGKLLASQTIRQQILYLLGFQGRFGYEVGPSKGVCVAIWAAGGEKKKYNLSTKSNDIYLVSASKEEGCHCTGDVDEEMLWNTIGKFVPVLKIVSPLLHYNNTNCHAI